MQTQAAGCDSAALLAEAYHFVIEPAPNVADESVDAVVAAYLRMCRSLIGHR